jgi:hypothetical protein
MQDVVDIIYISVDVYRDQDDIGPTMMLRGFIANEWTRLLTDMGAPQPQKLMVFLLRTMWDEIFTPLLKARNTLLHNNPNFTTDLTHTQLGEIDHYGIYNIKINWQIKTISLHVTLPHPSTPCLQTYTEHGFNI